MGRLLVLWSVLANDEAFLPFQVFAYFEMLVISKIHASLQKEEKKTQVSIPYVFFFLFFFQSGWSQLFQAGASVRHCLTSFRV